MGQVRGNPRTNGRDVAPDSQWERSEIDRQLMGANQSNQSAATGTQCVWNFLKTGRHSLKSNQSLSITCVQQELHVGPVGHICTKRHSMLEVHSGKERHTQSRLALKVTTGTPNPSCSNLYQEQSSFSLFSEPYIQLSLSNICISMLSPIIVFSHFFQI